MLAGVALAGAWSPHEWVAAFLVRFGIWDLASYIFLKLLLRWAGSLITWDILFLIPVPSTGRVLAPVLVSISTIGCGLALLSREYNN
jgi:hypothetical protein